MGRGRELEAAIRISGELDASLRSAIDQAIDRLSNMSRNTRQTADAVNGLSADLRRSSSEIRDTEDATQRLSNGLEDVNDSARQTEDGFTVMEGAIAGLIANGISTLIGKCVDAATSLYDLAESTREYREDMGKLETAWESANKSTELATETYKEFYSVLGEEDRSVEAVNHLAKFVDTESDLTKWTNIATGVWGTFGDSLPVEGLTEASNETAKVSKVTGVLADASIGLASAKMQ
ncbi:MAG: hypothetical protein ACLUDG_01940 [Butyricicoccus sp.]